MRLYLVQHGQAFPACVHPNRPLTDQGRRTVANVAALLARGQPQSVPHRPQRQDPRPANGEPIQAHDIHPSREKPRPDSIPTMRSTPGSRRSMAGRKTACSSNQPFLGKLVSRLVLGEERTVVDYLPGTVVCLERASAGDWRIVGMLGPVLL